MSSLDFKAAFWQVAVMTTNRRGFLGGFAAALAGFSILPAATTYTRLWKATRTIPDDVVMFNMKGSTIYRADGAGVIIEQDWILPCRPNPNGFGLEISYRGQEAEYDRVLRNARVIVQPFTWNRQAA